MKALANARESARSRVVVLALRQNPAETPKAVDVRVARETMEPRQTEFKCCRASTPAQGPMTASGDWRRDLAALTHSRSVRRATLALDARAGYCCALPDDTHCACSDQKNGDRTQRRFG